MGVYKRGDTWGISYFHNGKLIRKTIGTNKKKAEAELEAIRVDIRGGRYKEPRRDSFGSGAASQVVSTAGPYPGKTSCRLERRPVTA
jgi:hypothetical protein